jgi:OOP family OmpA-OmpF porin
MIFAGVAAALLSGTSFADTKNQGYVVDSNFNIVTSANTGLCWHTSDWTPARAVAQCDPVYVAQAPAPVAAKPPVVAPAAPVAAAPVKAPMQKIQFSADALFDFDKAVLKPAGKTMLDDLARDLKTVQYDVIAVTGHTDRFGSEAYNQKLSERRANAVKDYLTGRDIPAAKITAEGKGKSQPETKAGDCLGKKSAKVIACLQPDRRVDVEVTETKPATPAAR